MTSVLELSLSLLGDWTVILGLIFGGCCSNAWALEIAASQNKNAGTLITLAQFILVSLVGLPKRLCILRPAHGKEKHGDVKQWEPFHFATLVHQPSALLRVRFRSLAIPVSKWIVQVVLFLLTSLLNNMAFKYRVPMAIHIIFRSAGLVTNLLIGKLWAGKRYTRLQVLSVLIVTAGVVLTTVSTRPGKPAAASLNDDSSGYSYAIGIGILTGALLLSSAMGLVQDKTYAEYGRGHWEEGMFYLHFLALPMFIPLTGDIREQVFVLNSSPPVDLLSFTGTPGLKGGSGIHIPVFWIPLIFNIATQLVCVSGVHRLTAKVSSLTVTLVLAVRKAVSLVLSVVVIGGGSGDRWLWVGSFLVLLGTVVYAWDGTREKSKSEPVRRQRLPETAKQD